MRYVVSLLMAFAVLGAFAQAKDNASVKADPLSADAIIFIDGKRVEHVPGQGVDSHLNINALVNPMDIESIDVIKGEAAIKAYGEAGQNGLVFITTRKSQQPIYFIDGIKVPGANREILSTINPEQIQSVQVVKSDSARKTYGESGRNGVILITTKKSTQPKSNQQK